LSLLYLGFLISGGASTEDRKSLKCKNPSGKLWSSIFDKNCGQSVCQKTGKKASWRQCPKAATEAKIEEVIKKENEILKEVIENQAKVLDEKIEKVTKMQEVMENRLMEIKENLFQNCGEEPVEMTTSEEGPIEITTTTGSSGLGWHIVFQKREEFTLRRNHKLGDLLVLGKEYIITFELLLIAAFSSYYGNIIHFTIGGDGQQYGDRTPVLFVHDETRLHLASAIDGDTNYHFNTPALSLNTWHSIEISQVLTGSQIVFTMKVDGVTQVNKSNNKAETFTNVEIFAGDDWYEVATGKMKALIVKTNV